MREGEVSGSSQTAVWAMAWGGPGGAKRPARRGAWTEVGQTRARKLSGKPLRGPKQQRCSCGG